MGYEPKKDCFAYDKRCDKCRALNDLYCRKQQRCSFYKKNVVDKQAISVKSDKKQEVTGPGNAYYQFRLDQYLKEHYGKYLDEIVYFPRASINSCEFLIPSRGEIIKLVCNPEGRIAVLRKVVSKKYGC